MVRPFSFKGDLRRAPYAVAALVLFFSQHLGVVAAFRLQGLLQPDADVAFFIAPLRALTEIYPGPPLLAGIYGAPPLFALLAMAYLVIVAWAVAALSFQRATNAGASGWIAAFTIAPLIQIPAILYLCVAPLLRTPSADRTEPLAPQAEADWTAAAQGVVAAIGVTLFAVAVGALVFGSYGFGMFLVSPFVVGALTAYIANRRRDLGAARTIQVVLVAGFLGGVALIVAALEGAICIVLAAPLGAAVAVIGGLLGRAVALRGGRSSKHTLSAVALVPLVFATEHLLPATTHFDTLQTIEIDAPPAAVWRALLHIDMTAEPIDLPYRLGLAHPLRGDVLGEGVGATRRGAFSTGVALERVTEWTLDRKLAFVVETDVPALRELSFYDHVHAPHAVGYFRTGLTSFELVPKPGDRTTLVERTAHEIRLEPIVYWMPLARWVVDRNNARVLAHLKRTAEKSRSDGL